MANNLAVLNGGVPAAFQSIANIPDMNAAAKQGLLASFAVVGYKGSNWRLKYRGEDMVITDDRGPVPSLPIVIVGVSPAISKIWYEKKFTEGDNEAPDCWSTDGIAPDAGVGKKQSNTCASCKQNVWGSRMTDAGKKAKACQDSRRIAVLPSADLENEAYGGPMLLRIPPMSLGNFASYCGELQRYGAQPCMVETIIKFDYNVAYPLIVFETTGWLSAEQADQVVSQLTNPLIDRILETPIETATADPAGDQAAASPLAGGVPDHAAQAQAAQAQAEAQARDQAAAKAKAEADAKARADSEAIVERDKAELAAKAQAAQAAHTPAPAATKAAGFGKKAATTTAAPAAAAPAKAPSPFGAKASNGAAAPTAAAVPVQTPAPAPAGDALAQEIDALLGA